jgi:type II secretory pathway component GspD/PulD (secretin)
MRRILAAFIATALTTAALAQTYTEVMPLRSRLPEDVVPAIRPLLGPDEGVSAFNGKLIVRAAPERMEEIRQLLAEIDRPLRRFVIHVRQRDAHQGSLGSPPPVRDLRTLGQNERSERVQTVEGRPAFIRSGTAVPVPTWQSFGGGALPFAQQGFDYRDATAGFNVTPRLAGDTVVLEISRQAVHAGQGAPPSFTVNEAATTLRARPGEWVTLGAVTGSVARDGGVRRHATRRTDDTAIQVMVEVLPED